MGEKSIETEINNWEISLNKYEFNDFSMLYDNWMNQAISSINPKIRSKFSLNMDNFLFHTHAYLQGSATQKEARERIIMTARIFDESIDTIYDLSKLTIDQLTYIAGQYIAKGRLYSVVQGGLTGTGGFLLLGLDFPLMVVMNLRVVQLIGLTFGKEVNHPYEMMLSLKVFHAATLPKRFQKQAWNELKDELNDGSSFLYEGEDKLTNRTWMDQPLKQTFKNLLIIMGRKKIVQGIPILSMGVGAYFNYQLTQQVANFALRFYQLRYLNDLQKMNPK
ncbi:EcsC family protein [Aquibacillus kalidii]|uniref:EcsC family protein n=1 Tax=Aquibacillus kalidii TaxID=2762597 RepID=UPI001C996C53|nr:EcsC family protein [Aquibacillus kalidii]